VSLVSRAPGPIRVLDMAGADYRHAFELFLAGTDEKAVTSPRLARIAAGLPQRGLLVDVGAGQGGTTAHLAPSFARVIAVEPSAVLRERLRAACPRATVLPETAEKARIVPGSADLVLCSHVLYYVPRPSWLPVARRMLEWVRPGGELLLMLQNPGNPCMEMVRRFTGARFPLDTLAAALAADPGAPVASWSLETLPVRYRTRDLEAAVDVAEFALNVPGLADLRVLPRREDVERHVREHFLRPDGSLVMRHDHDLLRVRRSAG
jgi:SAM-dependent methyltransferase